MRSGADGDLLKTLTSMTIRRPIRLYGPLIASSLLVFLLGRLGVYAYTGTFTKGFLEWDEGHYHPQSPYILTDFYIWAKSTVNFCLAQIDHWSTPAAHYPGTAIRGLYQSNSAPHSLYT